MKKKMNLKGIIIFGLVLLTFFNTHTVEAQRQRRSQQAASEPAQTASAQTTPTQPASPFWTGDGGRGKSITILPPRGIGLAANQAYLPDFVANELVANFSSFTAMTLFDRVNNQRQYDELLSGYYSDNDAAGLDLGNLTSTDYMLLGDITRTSTGFALQLTVNRNSDKTTVATFSQTVSIAELDNLSGVRRASLDLIQKMGVTPTELARTELNRAATTNHANAQTALAQGITAQRQGTEVTALSYFFQAATIDPSLLEASGRATTLNANITSGNMGENIRNDIEWRRQWVARLTETEELFRRAIDTMDPPYTLFYSTGIRQGNINYQTETADLSIDINFYPRLTWFRSMERAAQAVLDGLHATGRAQTWGLANWPTQGVTNRNPFGQNKQYDFSVVFELLNNQNQVIGRQTVRLTPSYNFSLDTRSNPRAIISNYVPARDYRGDVNVSGGQLNESNGRTVTFNAVKADDISDNLSIRIASINGARPENARFPITALTAAQWQEYSNNTNRNFRILYGYVLNVPHDRNQRIFNIPFEVWGEPITHIINRVIVVDEITTITIGANVTLYENSIQKAGTSGLVHFGFLSAYENNGRRAGTYTHTEGQVGTRQQWVIERDRRGNTQQVFRDVPVMGPIWVFTPQ